jgi:hypothetical protein
MTLGNNSQMKPRTPSLFPSDGERVVGGRGRGDFSGRDLFREPILSIERS